jgi:isopentenyl diphosphate isomerase/L-lactate dehydrogenase-like FMN-dependent dehydrogenase
VLDLLTAEMRRTMCMLGTPTIDDISPAHVRLRAV